MGMLDDAKRLGQKAKDLVARNDEKVKQAIDKEGIAIPFEVRSSLQATKHEEDGQAKVPLSADDCDRGSEACTNAEGGLRSEASTMQAQAGQARLQESHELLSSRNGSK